MLLKNKTAVITGCNRGIGFSVLELFSKNGANIVACVRKKDDNFLKKVKDLTKLNNNGDSGLYVNRGADIDLRGFRLSIYHNGMYKKNRFGYW